VLGAAVMALVPELRHAFGDTIHGDADGLRTRLRDLDVAGVLVMWAVQLAHAVAMYPAEIVTVAAGYVYGTALGLPLVMGGWLLNAFAAYAIGRYAARSALYRLAGKERFEATAARIDRGGARILLIARLIPVIPFSFTGYAAGAAHIPLWRYTWTTVVGYLPLCAVTVVLGEALFAL
jgi:uncharacterized membrane protein YdjX (TVP38/TMEM64 family)